MRHVYECPLRWADLDMLGHVNNVTYVDYLQEARVDMLRTHAPDQRADDLAEGVVVARNQVTYVAPLTLRPSIAIECWVTEIRAASFTLAYEVFDTDEDGNRITYLRARSLLTPFVFALERPRRISAPERESLERFLEPEEPFSRLPTDAADPERDSHYPVAVRFSDVDVFGHVNNVKYFEYFQEARVAELSRLFGRQANGKGPFSTVVAQVDVEYKRPVLFRPEPYDAYTWISRVGDSSYHLSAEIHDGAELLARSRAVLVGFDPETQRASRPEEKYHQILRDQVRPART